MSDIGEMLTKAAEGITRQFNAQVEASIAMLVNSGIPLEHIELIHRTTDDMSVVTEVRSRTSDEDQAVAIEREAIAGWLESKAEWLVKRRTWLICEGCVQEAHDAEESERDARLYAQSIRSGEHVKP